MLFHEVIVHSCCGTFFFTNLGLVSDCRGDLRKCADYMKRAIQTAELVAFLLTILSSRCCAWIDSVDRASVKRHSVCKTPLPSARQHPNYGDCLEVKREYYLNCSVLDCVTQCSQSAAHLCEQFLQVQQIGFVTLGPLHPVLYYYNTVEWFWWDSSLIWFSSVLRHCWFGHLACKTHPRNDL